MPSSTGIPNSPVEFITERGYTSPPLCTQFSVFLDNRVGKLHELVGLFDETPIRLVALSVFDSSDHAVVRVVTTNSDESRKLLKQRGKAFSESEILVVELGQDQRMTKICMSLLAAELNIFYAYPLMARPHGSATIAIHTDDQVLAGQILRRKGFDLIDEQQLRDSFGSDLQAG